MPRPSVGTKVGWGRRATSALATQVLTSPPKYFKRAKLGRRVWWRLSMQWALRADLLLLVLLTRCWAKSRAVSAPWDSTGFDREFLLACWCLHSQCGEKKRKQRATCRSLCADFRISEDHFQCVEPWPYSYRLAHSAAVAVPCSCSPHSSLCSRASKTKWIGAKYSLRLNTDYRKPGSFAG